MSSECGRGGGPPQDRKPAAGARWGRRQPRRARGGGGVSFPAGRGFWNFLQDTTTNVSRLRWPPRAGRLTFSSTVPDATGRSPASHRPGPGMDVGRKQEAAQAPRSLPGACAWAGPSAATALACVCVWDKAQALTGRAQGLEGVPACLLLAFHILSFSPPPCWSRRARPPPPCAFSPRTTLSGCPPACDTVAC